MKVAKECQRSINEAADAYADAIRLRDDAEALAVEKRLNEEYLDRWHREHNAWRVSVGFRPLDKDGKEVLTIGERIGEALGVGAVLLLIVVGFPAALLLFLALLVCRFAPVL